MSRKLSFLRIAMIVTLVFLSGVSSSSRAQVVDDCCGVCGARLCANRFEDAEKIPQLVEASSHLFYGIVVLARTSPCCTYLADVTFRVRLRWKGAEESEVTVRTGGGCSKPWPFAIGHWYLVSAEGPGTKEQPASLNDCIFRPLDEQSASRQISALESWRRSKQGSGNHK